jgi:hypothetical protein
MKPYKTYTFILKTFHNPFSNKEKLFFIPHAQGFYNIVMNYYLIIKVLIVKIHPREKIFTFYKC